MGSGVGQGTRGMIQGDFKRLNKFTIQCKIVPSLYEITKVVESHSKVRDHALYKNWGLMRLFKYYLATEPKKVAHKLWML